MRSRLIASFAAGVLISGLVVGGFAVAQPDEVEFTACVKNNNGQMRLVDSGDDCRTSEYPVTWNQAGQPGPPGPSGQSRGYSAGVGDTLISVGGPPVDLMVLDVPAGDYVMNLSLTARAEGGSAAGADCRFFEEAPDGSRIDLTGVKVGLFGVFADSGLQQIESTAFTSLLRFHPVDAKLVLVCESLPQSEEDLFIFSANWTVIEVDASTE